jgi:hypothetical protein
VESAAPAALSVDASFFAQAAARSVMVTASAARVLLCM